MALPLLGGCLCGAIRYRISAEPAAPTIAIAACAGARQAPSWWRA
jgi:hypothetical protein